ncbi:MAG: prolyl oligopeptidase family serine peptidase, partial [Pseudomonadota bacterium]
MTIKIFAAALTVVAAPSLGYAEPDPSLEAISPSSEAVSVGLAGSDPADIARYLMARGAGSAALSPDGETVAFIFSATGERQLWTVPATGGQPRQITFGNGVTFFRWAPDGESLLYGADNNGDEQEAYYQIAADGGAETLVLPAVEGGFRRFGAFSADGETIAYASTERNGLDFDIYTADLESGQSKRVYEGRFGFFAQSVSPDGAHIVVTETVGEDADNLYLLNTQTGALLTLSKPAVEDRANHSDGGMAWSDDARALYLASSAGRDFAALMRYDIESGAAELIASADHDIENVSLCSAGDRYLAWTENRDGFDALRIRDRKRGRDIAPPALPEGVYSLSCTEDTNKLLVRINGWRTPGDLYVIDLKTLKAARVFASTMAGLDADRLVRPESVRLTARDGVTLQGMLYLPDETSRKDAGAPPVLFQVHGGPSGQSRANFDPIVQYHVDRGVAVFEPNVRGSTGFGRAYSALDDREKRLDSIRDLIDMLDHLRKDGRVDAGRAAVAGGSYGGYAVNAVLAAYPDAFIAGVSLFSVADWVTALEVASPALKASDIIEYGDINEPQWRAFYT